MNEKKFTPGPWATHFVGHGESAYADILQASDTNVVIATCGPTAEELANAHLIAAAPDLYDALENLIDDCLIVAESLNDYPPCTQPSMSRNDASKKLKQYAADCQSALAKARGEA